MGFWPETPDTCLGGTCSAPGGRMPIPMPPAAKFASTKGLFRTSLNKLFTTAYAQQSMSKTIKFESKSIKKATFSVKKRSKTSAFRHAHLNILGGHPLWR